MTWRCPSCNSDIQHGSSDGALAARTIHRCAVCRLELLADAPTGKMVVAVTIANRKPKAPRKRRP